MVKKQQRELKPPSTYFKSTEEFINELKKKQKWRALRLSFFLIKAFDIANPLLIVWWYVGHVCAWRLKINGFNDKFYICKISSCIK